MIHTLVNQFCGSTVDGLGPDRLTRWTDKYGCEHCKFELL